MRLAMTLLGLDLLTVEISTDDGDNGTDPGDCTSTQVGFAPTPGAQRWEQGPDL